MSENYLLPYSLHDVTNSNPHVVILSTPHGFMIFFLFLETKDWGILKQGVRTFQIT